MYKGNFYVRHGKRIFIVHWEIDITPTGTIWVTPHWGPGDTLRDVLTDNDVESIIHAVREKVNKDLAYEPGYEPDLHFHFLTNEAIDAGSSVG